MRINRILPSALMALCSLLLAAFLAACGSDTSTQSAPVRPVDQSTEDTTCFTQMDPDQKNQLVSFLNSSGGTIQNIENNADGTQDICVLERDQQGNYQQHYYNQQDYHNGFSDYLLYSALFGRSSTLATYALISNAGNLDAGDILALSLLTGVGRDGGLYHEYDYRDGSWGRQRTAYVDNTTHKTVNVKNTTVYYGTGPNQVKKSFDDSVSQAPPKGYAKATVPASTGQNATATKGNNGKSSVTTSGVTSSSVRTQNTAPANAATSYGNNSANRPQATTTRAAQPTTARNVPPQTAQQQPPRAQQPPRTQAPRTQAPAAPRTRTR